MEASDRAGIHIGLVFSINKKRKSTSATHQVEDAKRNQRNSTEYQNTTSHSQRNLPKVENWSNITQKHSSRNKSVACEIPQELDQHAEQDLNAVIQDLENIQNENAKASRQAIMNLNKSNKTLNTNVDASRHSKANISKSLIEKPQIETENAAKNSSFGNLNKSNRTLHTNIDTTRNSKTNLTKSLIEIPQNETANAAKQISFGNLNKSNKTLHTNIDASRHSKSNLSKSLIEKPQNETENAAKHSSLGNLNKLKFTGRPYLDNSFIITESDYPHFKRIKVSFLMMQEVRKIEDMLDGRVGLEKICKEGKNLTVEYDSRDDVDELKISVLGCLDKMFKKIEVAQPRYNQAYNQTYGSADRNALLFYINRFYVIHNGDDWMSNDIVFYDDDDARKMFAFGICVERVNELVNFELKMENLIVNQFKDNPVETMQNYLDAAFVTNNVRNVYVRFSSFSGNCISKDGKNIKGNFIDLAYFASYIHVYFVNIKKKMFNTIIKLDRENVEEIERDVEDRKLNNKINAVECLFRKIDGEMCICSLTNEKRIKIKIADALDILLKKYGQEIAIKLDFGSRLGVLTLLTSSFLKKKYIEDCKDYWATMFPQVRITRNRYFENFVYMKCQNGSQFSEFEEYIQGLKLFTLPTNKEEIIKNYIEKYTIKNLMFYVLPTHTFVSGSEEDLKQLDASFGDYLEELVEINKITAKEPSYSDEMDFDKGVMRAIELGLKNDDLVGKLYKKELQRFFKINVYYTKMSETFQFFEFCVYKEDISYYEQINPSELLTVALEKGVVNKYGFVAEYFDLLQEELKKTYPEVFVTFVSEARKTKVLNTDDMKSEDMLTEDKFHGLKNMEVVNKSHGNKGNETMIAPMDYILCTTPSFLFTIHEHLHSVYKRDIVIEDAFVFEYLYFYREKIFEGFDQYLKTLWYPESKKIKFMGSYKDVMFGVYKINDVCKEIECIEMKINEKFDEQTCVGIQDLVINEKILIQFMNQSKSLLIYGRGDAIVRYKIVEEAIRNYPLKKNTFGGYRLESVIE
jgi:hypothetical protein